MNEQCFNNAGYSVASQAVTPLSTLFHDIFHMPPEQFEHIMMFAPLSELTVSMGNNHSQTSGFEETDFHGICNAIQNPQDLTIFQPDEHGKLRNAKANCMWFMPNNCSSKLKADIEAHNQFPMLTGDVDVGNLPLKTIVNTVRELIPGTAFGVYSTISATPDDRRWRVVIPLHNAIILTQWYPLQKALVFALDGDDCTTRSQQISYLPALSFFNRDCYEYHIEEGEPLDPLNSVFAQEAAALAAQMAKDAAEREVKVMPAPRKEISLSGGRISIFDALNKSVEWDDLLLWYKYTPHGDKWRYPSSTSGSPGVTISYRDDPNGRYVSSHTSDPLCDGHAHSKFDVYCQFNHAGNRDAAMIALGNELKAPDGRTLTEYNQHVYAQKKAAEVDNQAQQVTEVATSQSQPEASQKIQEILDNETIQGHVNITQYAPDNIIFLYGQSVAKSAQFPEQTAAIVTLGAFSSAANGAYTVQYRDRTPLSLGLYLVSEQPPGSAKSRILNAATKAIRRRFSELRQEASIRKEQLCPDGKVTKENKAEVEAIRFTTPYITDSTPEALESKLAEQGGYFGIASAEQASVDTLLGTNLDRKNNNDVILKAYTGNEQHVSCRVGRSGYNGSPFGSVNVIAQEGTIETILAKSNGQGIAERFLMLSEPNLLGTRRYHQYLKVDSDLQAEYEELVADLVNKYDIQQPDNIHDLHALTISDAGWKLIDNYRERIEPFLADGEKYSHSILRGAFSKADIQIMKIAALLHLAGPRRDKPIISDVQVSQSIGIVNELLNNLYNIMEAKGIIGLKAEYTAILACFNKNTFRTERQLIDSRKKVNPFKDMTNKNDAIRKAIAEMTELKLLMALKDDKGVTQYSIGQ